MMTLKHPTKKPKYFTSNSPAYLFLAESFKQYSESGGTTGINPFITEKREIDSVYEKYSVFRDYSKSTFPNRFRALADKFKVASFKHRQREDSLGESIYVCVLFIIVFYFTNLF